MLPFNRWVTVEPFTYNEGGDRAQIKGPEILTYTIASSSVFSIGCNKQNNEIVLGIKVDTSSDRSGNNQAPGSYIPFRWLLDEWQTFFTHNLGYSAFNFAEWRNRNAKAHPPIWPSVGDVFDTTAHLPRGVFIIRDVRRFQVTLEETTFITLEGTISSGVGLARSSANEDGTATFECLALSVTPGLPDDVPEADLFLFTDRIHDIYRITSPGRTDSDGVIQPDMTFNNTLASSTFQAKLIAKEYQDFSRLSAINTPVPDLFSNTIEIRNVKPEQMNPPFIFAYGGTVYRNLNVEQTGEDQWRINADTEF